jgi:tetratricopeptide (TPR) repeat protein
MRVRRVLFASVSSVFLAASAAVSGPAFAATTNANMALVEKAYQALMAGDRESAIAGYSQAIESRELKPEALANALLNRALAHQQLGQHDKAVDDYTAALRLDAMSGELRATALYNRGLAYQKQQQTVLAIEDFTGALFLNSSFAHAYLSRANALRESGQFLFALSDYEKALRYKHPDTARVRYGEALTYEALQRQGDAVKSLKLALEANPEFSPAKERLAAIGTAKAPAAAADPMTTGSLGTAGGKLLVRKPSLPKAVEPPANLADATPGYQAASAQTNDPVLSPPEKKTITDRVPAEEDIALNQNPAVTEEAAPPEEKVVAIEAVPEDQPKAEPEAAAETASIAEAPAEEPAAETAPITGWTIQVASATSEDAAWSTWKKMQKRSKALADVKPAVIKADLGKKGIYFRVRLTGYDDKTAANKMCSKLKSSGVSCFVSKAGS